MEGYKYEMEQARFDDWTITPNDLGEVFSRGLEAIWNYVKKRSLDYMDSSEFGGVNLYLIDDDHNYYTVPPEEQAYK